jgi:putative transcriptional regulator
MIEHELFSNTESKPFDSLEGRILVANKSLDGSCFEKALIYICAHDENGAIGVNVNHRIGSLSLKAAIKLEKALPKKNEKLFPVVFGGPVESSRFVILSMNKEQKRNFDINHAITVHTDCDGYLTNYVSGKSSDKFLIAKGIAAWEPNQLEQEVAENSWLIVDPNIDIIFSQRIKNKWDRVIKQLGVRDLSNLVGYCGEA